MAWATLLPANNQTVKISLQTAHLPASFPLETHIILEWLRDAGVSHVIGDQPFGTFQAFVNTAQNPLTSLAEPAAAPVRQTAAAVSSNWTEILSGFSTLEQLQSWTSTFRELSLCRTATQAVLGAGQVTQPILMVVAEAPDATEDQSGKTYSGAALNLLQQALSHLPIPAGQIYMTYLSKWRPPGQRSLSVPELDLAQAMLLREIQLVQPRNIIALGDPVFKALSRLADSVTAFEAGGDSPDSASHSVKTPLRSVVSHKIYNIVFKHENVNLRFLSLQKPEIMLKDVLTKKRIWQGLLSFCRSLATS